MEKALKLHMNNCSPFIQNYHNFLKISKNIEKDELKHLLEAEPYRYTLKDVIEVCKK